MSTGYPDGQKITQWIGAPIAQAVAAAIGAGQIVIGPTRLSSWASVIVALKPTGGQVTITVTQTVPNGPAGLVLQQQVVVPAGGTVFESFVLFGASVTITLQGAVGGTTVDYAVTPSNTTTNAQVLTNATINVQKADALVAAEPTLDFRDADGSAWTLTDDATNTRVIVQVRQAAIAESLLPVAAASIDVQNIPATFAHLVGVMELEQSVGAAEGLLRFNNDSGNNYRTSQQAQFAGAAYAPSASALISAGWLGTFFAGAPPRAGISFVVIPAYRDATYYKGFVVLGHYLGAVPQLETIGGQWENTAAINRVTVVPGGGGNWVAAGRFDLYGWNGL